MEKTPETLITILAGAQSVIEDVDHERDTDNRLYAVIGAIEAVKQALEAYTDDALEQMM